MVIRPTLPRKGHLFRAEREGMGSAPTQSRQQGNYAREDDTQGRPQGSSGLEGPHLRRSILGCLHYGLLYISVPADDSRNFRVVLV